VKLIRIISVVVLISVLAVVGAGVGCGSKGGGGAASMMNMVSENSSSFYFMDIKALRGDEDLKDVYDDMMGDVDDALEGCGINVDDVDRIAVSGDDLLLLDGRFDLDELRDKLDSLDFDENDYKDIEVWESTDGTGWVALLVNRIVIGNEDAVQDCITVIKGGEDSLQDNPDASEVMARLPGGVVMIWGTGEALTEIVEEEYEGLEAGGLSLGKKDADTLKMTAVLKFEDEDAAKDATDQIKDDLEAENYEDINVDQDKEFVKVTAEIGIDDFLSEGEEPVTITIGELTGLTGIASSALIPVHYAMMDVARYYNDEKLIPGVKIKVVAYDNKSDPARDVPGYAWCKERGAELIIAPLSTTAEILTHFAEKDKLPIMALASTMLAIEPPGWVFNTSCPPRYETNTLLRWVSEEHWDYTKGIHKFGLVGWNLPNVVEIETAIKEYCQAYPDKFEWVGSFLAPAGTMAWSSQVEELKDCDYICTTGSPMATFMKQFQSAGYSATFLGVSAASAYRSSLVDELGYEALDGTLFANESLWWNESTPIVDLAKELLYRYHDSSEAEEIMNAGSGYVGATQQMVAVLEILSQAVAEVGAENFNSQAYYDAALKYKTEGSMWEGYPQWGFSQTKRYLTDHMVIYEFSAEAQDLVRVSGWVPLVLE
jgi:ABC-type branched-subunit amino acid transport system substrate-binding protein